MDDRDAQPAIGAPIAPPTLPTTTETQMHARKNESNDILIQYFFPNVFAVCIAALSYILGTYWVIRSGD